MTVGVSEYKAGTGVVPLELKLVAEDEPFKLSSTCACVHGQGVFRKFFRGVGRGDSEVLWN